jgi:hypothetical protein
MEGNRLTKKVWKSYTFMIEGELEGEGGRRFRHMNKSSRPLLALLFYLFIFFCIYFILRGLVQLFLLFWLEKETFTLPRPATLKAPIYIKQNHLGLNTKDFTPSLAIFYFSLFLLPNQPMYQVFTRHIWRRRFSCSLIKTFHIYLLP